jgi:hypothetical protein
VGSRGERFNIGSTNIDSERVFHDSCFCGNALGSLTPAIGWQVANLEASVMK